MKQTTAEDEETRLAREFAELNICSINGDNLGNEVKCNAERHRRVGQNLATARRLVKFYVRRKATIRAQLIYDIHKAAEKKVTDKAAEAEMRIDSEYIAACTDVEDMEYVEEQWANLWESYKSRGFDLGRTVGLALSAMGKEFIADDHAFPSRRAYTQAPPGPEPLALSASPSEGTSSRRRRGFPNG